MDKKNSLIESILYWLIKFFATFIRVLPVSMALWIGRLMGRCAYRFDRKHRIQAYANLRMAFGDEKSPQEIKRIVKEMFKNFGQNIIELLRLPLMTPEKYEHFVNFEGKEIIEQSLKQGKGVILLAMHYGSWEMASLACAMFKLPYKVFVKPQSKFSRLDDLLNTYRSCRGSVVIERGIGTRDVLKSLKNNEIIGMVVDQGGREGMIVPFFGRQAALSVGAIRLGLKLGVPLCFSVIHREKGPFHKVIVHEPIKLIDTGDLEKDLENNLINITGQMERFIRENPSEYMWFYKIWKYSKESQIVVLSDGKMGHQRQSESVALLFQKALSGRQIDSKVKIVHVEFKNKLLQHLFSTMLMTMSIFFGQGCFNVFKYFLTKSSFDELKNIKPDFVVSCGASMVGVNYLLSREFQSKSVILQKPSILPYQRFHGVFLPSHDGGSGVEKHKNVTITSGTPNLITKEYLNDQSQLLLNRYSHLKNRFKTRIGVLIGGNSKNVYLSEQQIRILIHQLKDAAQELNAEILITTSRRTSAQIEQILQGQFKNDPSCQLLILANKENDSFAVGGILGLSDIIVVSGDSISMVSEAASAGKGVVVFFPKSKEILFGGSQKHKRFIDKMNEQNYILSSDVQNIGRTIFDLAKGKLKTRPLDDQERMFKAIMGII